MFKRIFVILVVCLFPAPSFTAHADLIFEPENDFYAKHIGQIIYLGRSLGYRYCSADKGILEAEGI